MRAGERSGERAGGRAGGRAGAGTQFLFARGREGQSDLEYAYAPPEISGRFWEGLGENDGLAGSVLSSPAWEIGLGCCVPHPRFASRPEGAPKISGRKPVREYSAGE